MGKSFEGGPLGNDTKGANAIPHVYKQCPNVFGIFVRNKNGNIVVMEALTNSNGSIDKIESYWLDLEPSYRDAARKGGRKHDREEFGMFDNRGYGHTIKDTSDDRKKFIIYMNQLPRVPITIASESNGVNAYVTLKGELCRLEYIYVHDQTTLGLFPTVEYIEVHGINRKREKIVEKMVK